MRWCSNPTPGVHVDDACWTPCRVLLNVGRGDAAFRVPAQMSRFGDYRMIVTTEMGDIEAGVVIVAAGPMGSAARLA